MMRIVLLTRRVVSISASLLLMGALAGCAAPVIVTSPDTFDVPDDAARHLRAGGIVALKNAYQDETKVKIWTYSDSGWIGDLRQYTDTAITMLGREMQKKGVSLDPNAGKTITMRVFDVSASPGWVIESSLTLEARYGDGTKSTITTKNTSPSDAWRSVDGSLMFAVSRLLSDEKFLEYVNN